MMISKVNMMTEMINIIKNMLRMTKKERNMTSEVVIIIKKVLRMTKKVQNMIKMMFQMIIEMKTNIN